VNPNTKQLKNSIFQQRLQTPKTLLTRLMADGVSPSLPSGQQYDTAIASAHQVDPDYPLPDVLWTLQAAQQ
jgi:hypothetical protein